MLNIQSNTVMDNAGTVLEHIILTVMTSWACEQRPGSNVLYVDTHAMAPVNNPVPGGTQPYLVSDLIGSRGFIGTGQPLARVRPYFEAIQIADQQKNSGANGYYPTHFIHAIRAAQAANRHISAFLFENDSAGTGRQQAIKNWLANANHQAVWLKQNPTYKVTLAPHRSDFRSRESWSGLPEALGQGEILLIFSDPMNFLPEPSARSLKRKVKEDRSKVLASMYPFDFVNCIIPMIERITPFPPLIVHVIFAIGGNPGAWWGRFDRATECIFNSWRDAVSRKIPTAQGTHFKHIGVQWGGFLVVVCIFDSSGLSVGSSGAQVERSAMSFAEVVDDVRSVLDQLWSGKVELHPSDNYRSLSWL